MVEKNIHNIRLSADSVTRSESSLRQQLSALGILGEDTQAVEQTGLDSDEQRLEATYKGAYAQKQATELKELVASAGFDSVAFYAVNGSSPEDGYYALESRDIAPAHPREPRIQTAAVRITPKGKRGSKYRVVETNLDQLQNDFGTGTTAYVGVPASATNARWYRPSTGAREDATLVATRSSQLGDVAVYDAQDSSYDHPTLIFDVDYGEEWPTQTRVWDDRGHADKLDANGDVQWAKVYATDHDATGLLLVDNGLLRLTFNVGGNTLFAEEWDDSAGAWSTVTLGSSDWELFDVDLTRIGQGRVTAQVEFRDPTQSPTAYFALDMRLGRGATDAQWTVPPGESGSTPSGLITRLDPIASSSVISPTETWSLVDRSEVRK
jgi:hypothetical protein